VLSVVGTGDDVALARKVAYEATGQIRLRGGFYRHDIAANSASGPAAGPAAGTSATGITASGP